MDAVFAADVSESGKLTLRDRPAFDQVVKSLAGQPVDVVVRKHRRQRSSRQSRYYWGVCVAILAEHTGYTRDELHEALKWRFLRLEDADHPLPTVKSTTELTTAQFEEYLEQVRTFGSVELGCYIPLPNEIDD